MPGLHCEPGIPLGGVFEGLRTATAYWEMTMDNLCPICAVLISTGEDLPCGYAELCPDCYREVQQQADEAMFKHDFDVDYPY